MTVDDLTSGINRGIPMPLLQSKIANGYFRNPPTRGSVVTCTFRTSGAATAGIYRGEAIVTSVVSSSVREGHFHVECIIHTTDHVPTDALPWILISWEPLNR